LKVLLRQFDITTVYVTHDHYEALVLADLLAIMDRGRIEQVGTYEELYDRPRNAFVAAFLNRHVGAPPISIVDAATITQCRALGPVRVGVRPEAVLVSRDEAVGATPGIVAERLRLPLLNATVLRIRVGAEDVHAEVDATSSFAVGDRVWLTFTRYHVFDADGMRIRSEPEFVDR
jgi:ABC-type sugar transport system ATPase subunit